MIMIIMQRNRCRLWDGRDEIINLIIKECSKFAQKSLRQDTIGWES